MNINDYKIKTKILTGAMLLVAITIGFGLLARIYIGDVSGALFGITDNNGKSVEYATGVERMALQTVLNQRAYRISNKDEDAQKVEDSMKSLLEYLDQVDQVAKKYNNTELLSQSKVAREGTLKFGIKFREVVAAVKQNKL